MKLKTKNTESGFSLLELLLVVGVGALLLLAGIATYRLVTGGANVNEGKRLLTTVKEKVQRAYQDQRTYAGLATGTAINLGAIPAQYQVTAATAENPWGGALTVAVNAANNTRFDITMATVPRAACIELFTTYNANDPDLISVTVAGTATVAAAVNVANANTRCNAAAVAMMWTFR